MKAAILFCTVLIGLASSQPVKTLVPRGPPSGTEEKIGGVIKDGYTRYGPSGFDYSLPKKPVDQATSNNGKGIGGLPEGPGDGRIPKEHRPSTIPFNPDPNEPPTSGRPLNGQPPGGEGDGRIPKGKRPSTIPFNPDPNERLKSNPRTTCLKRGLGLCGQWTQAIKSSPTWERLQAARSRRVRITGSRGGKIAAFTILAPFAHDVLDTVKSWDNPIGASVKWFDDSMASLQEYIGGPQVPEIHGNELKLRIICWFRGVQEHKNDVDYACDRLQEKDRLEELEKNRPQKEKDMIDGLNTVIETCEYMVDHPPDDEKVLADLVERCDDLVGQAFDIEGWTKTQESAKNATPKQSTKKPPFIACALIGAPFSQCEPRQPAEKPAAAKKTQKPEKKPDGMQPKPKPKQPTKKPPFIACALNRTPFSQCEPQQPAKKPAAAKGTKKEPIQNDETNKSKKVGNPKLNKAISTEELET